MMRLAVSSRKVRSWVMKTIAQFAWQYSLFHHPHLPGRGGGGFIEEKQVSSRAIPLPKTHAPAPREHAKGGFLHGFGETQLGEHPRRCSGSVRSEASSFAITEPTISMGDAHGVVVHLTDERFGCREARGPPRPPHPARQALQGGLAHPLGPINRSGLQPDMNRHIREKRAGGKGFSKMAGGEKRGHEA